MGASRAVFDVTRTVLAGDITRLEAYCDKHENDCTEKPLSLTRQH